MSNFAEHLSSDRRLRILELLKESCGKANEEVILTALTGLGHRRTTRKTVRNDLRFLVDCGAVSDEWVNTLMVVDITRRGVDIANGAIIIEGIKSPLIGI